jgi:hypothetical protein
MSIELVSTVVVGSGGAASISFSSIPTDGTDLLLQLRTRTDNTNHDIRIYPNSSSSNHNWYRIFGFGDGMSGSNGLPNSTNLPRFTNISTSLANIFSNGSIYFVNYRSGTTKAFYSDYVFSNNSSQGGLNWVGERWADNTAISSLLIEPLAGSFVENTTASLYKITKGSNGTTTIS